MMIRVFLTLTLVGGEWSALPPGKELLVPFGWRLGELQRRPGRYRVVKILDRTRTRIPTSRLSIP
jgi:hypothetical protein